MVFGRTKYFVRHPDEEGASKWRWRIEPGFHGFYHVFRYLKHRIVPWNRADTSKHRLGMLDPDSHGADLYLHGYTQKVYHTQGEDYIT